MLKNNPNKGTGKSIAVLPFVNMSAKTEFDFFGDGIAEEIINALTKIQGLKVIARTSSFSYKKRELKIHEIGKELGVSSLLEGSVRASEKTIRINVQLINTSDGYGFWSESFERPMNDLLAIQSEISLIIADNLRENLGHFDIDETQSAIFSIPVDAYKLYLQARFLIRRLNMPDTEKAISILKKVIGRVPEFTLAYLELHAAYSFLGAIGAASNRKTFEQGNSYLEQAISLEKDLPECLYQLAQIQLWQKWDLDEALKLLANAVQKKPSYADAYQLMGFVLVLQGNFEAALYYQERVMKLNPMDANSCYQKGVIFYFEEDYKQAEIQYKKSISLDPGYMFSYVMLASSFLIQNRIEDALHCVQNIPASSDADLSKIFINSLIFAYQKDTQNLNEGIGRIELLLDSDLQERAMIMLIYLFGVKGAYDKAIDLSQKALYLKLPMLLLLRKDPLLKNLRAQPRFIELLGEAKKKDALFIVPNKKYEKSLFKDEDVQKYRAQLERLMREGKPHLDPQLTLRSLAEMLPLHPNYLSQLLNQSFNQNFSEFVNSYRLETFKEKANEPTCQQYTILALAFESGFNSKSSFNTFFKKVLGITPRQYYATIKR